MPNKTYFNKHFLIFHNAYYSQGLHHMYIYVILDLFNLTGGPFSIVSLCEVQEGVKPRMFTVICKGSGYLSSNTQLMLNNK